MSDQQRQRRQGPHESNADGGAFADSSLQSNRVLNLAATRPNCELGLDKKVQTDFIIASEDDEKKELKATDGIESSGSIALQPSTVLRLTKRSSRSLRDSCTMNPAPSSSMNPSFNRGASNDKIEKSSSVTLDPATVLKLTKRSSRTLAASSTKSLVNLDSDDKKKEKKETRRYHETQRVRRIPVTGPNRTDSIYSSTRSVSLDDSTVLRLTSSTKSFSGSKRQLTADLTLYQELESSDIPSFSDMEAIVVIEEDGIRTTTTISSAEADFIRMVREYRTSNPNNDNNGNSMSTFLSLTETPHEQQQQQRRRRQQQRQQQQQQQQQQLDRVLEQAKLLLAGQPYKGKVQTRQIAHELNREGIRISAPPRTAENRTEGSLSRYTSSELMSEPGTTQDQDEERKEEEEDLMNSENTSVITSEQHRRNDPEINSTTMSGQQENSPPILIRHRQEYATTTDACRDDVLGDTEPLDRSLGTTHTNDEQGGSVLTPSELISAFPVEEEDDDDDDGDITATQAAILSTKDMAKLARPALRRKLIITGVCVVVAIIIAVAVYFGIPTNKAAITSAPTMVPTSSPSAFFRGGRKNLLRFLTHQSANSTPLMTPNTSQNTAFEWLSNELDSFTDDNQQRIMQRYALAVFYYATSGPSWRETHDFLTSGTECRWFKDQINCDANDTITEMLLAEVGLNGTLPPELVHLSSLEVIEMQHNHLHGTIPPEWFTGMTKLRSLEMQVNNLMGPIPDQLFNASSLQHLSLEQNNLSGTISPKVGNLRNLTHLHASYNQFHGTLPETLFELSSLHTLILSSTNLEGSLSTQFGRLKNLRELNLLSRSSTSLTGTIPTELGELTNLERLFLFAMSYEGRLNGTIPTEIGRLQNLMKLSFRGHALSGSLPTELALLTALVSLQLDGNNFVGDIDFVCNAGLFGLKGVSVDYSNVTCSCCFCCEPGQKLY